jgi:RNA polymerase sigma-70 factor (ECF subfamily)
MVTMADNADRGPADAVRPSDDDGPSDRSLLRLYRHGSQEAARVLYQRYAHRLRALARLRKPSDLEGRVDDDDIVQSVFGSFFRKVTHGNYDAPAGEELWNLFVVITLNKIHAKGVYHRAAKRDVHQTVGGVEIDQYPDELVSESLACAALRMSIEEALEQLPEQHRVVIRLRMEDHEVSEIARLTQRSKRSVERILQESRKRLADLLEDWG